MDAVSRVLAAYRATIFNLDWYTLELEMVNKLISFVAISFVVLSVHAEPSWQIRTPRPCPVQDGNCGPAQKYAEQQTKIRKAKEKAQKREAEKASAKAARDAKKAQKARTK
jgi:hypothetical protein